MNKILLYLKYVLKHKWFVFLECCEEGILWQGITHDLSKLRPDEFFPYANYFYGKKNDISRGRDKTGYYKAGFTEDEAFNFAWLLHQKRNPHHWQWWILPEDEGGFKVLEMPLRYKKEMLCDWEGARKAQKNTGTVKEWYLKNKDKMSLATNTRVWIEYKLGLYD